MAMISGDSWILANINVTGFYRVNYDLGNWERLIAQLNADHKVHTFILRSNCKRAVPNFYSNCLLLCTSPCCVGFTIDKQSPACG